MKSTYIVVLVAVKPEPGSRLKTMSLRLLYLILFILFAQMNALCAIRVPDDYPSLQEAVEHSAAVDEIVITAENAELLESYGDVFDYLSPIFPRLYSEEHSIFTYKIRMWNSKTYIFHIMQIISVQQKAHNYQMRIFLID